MRQNKDLPQFKIHWQLLLVLLVGVAFWAVFYRWAPNWALWTIASMLGVGASIVLGAGYQRVADRKKKSDEIRHRAELQETIDNAAAIADPYHLKRLNEKCDEYGCFRDRDEADDCRHEFCPWRVKEEKQATIDRTQAYCEEPNQMAIDEAWNNADATARASALRRARRMLSNVDFVGQHDQTPSSADHLTAVKDAVLRNRLYENLASITPDNKLKIPIDAETPLDLKVLDGLTVEQINSVRHTGENHE